jgi:acetate kinase
MRLATLTLNGGSSSLKFALFAPGQPAQRQLSGRIERIGQSGTSLVTKDAAGTAASPRPVAAPDLASAATAILAWLDERVGLANLRAIGHRVVHGGSRYTESQLITPGVVDDLDKLSPLDPEHLPGEIAVIRACRRRLPEVPQIACFDTAFHHDLPRVAQLMAIPLRYAQAGVRRYGFHGLSYAYLMQELERVAGARAAAGRVILAHLGNGASLAAVHDGKCVDTTMAFTPTAGLVMGTRSGDLDPGVLIHFARSESMNADALDELVNRRSGLIGLSETSADVRDLLARSENDPRARDAIAVFCYQARKWIAAMAAALGGVDTLVFAGGIGENSAQVRSEICGPLAFIGIELDTDRNAKDAALISTDTGLCDVRVIHTDEELMIAHEVGRLLGDPARPGAASP